MPRILASALAGLLLATASGGAGAAPDVRLDTSQEPPYQVFQNGQLSGLAIEVLDCIFARLDKSHHIQMTSWSRARLNVRQHLADGFFSASPDPQSDAYAQLSAPLLVEKWYWYARDAQTLTRQPWEEDARIGGVLGSNSLSWLELRGLPVKQRVNRHEQLIRLLERQRIDLFLADEQVMHSALEQRPEVVLQRRFARYSPLGVYFARDFLDAHPGFLAAFNDQLQSCAKPGAPLAENEQRYLEQLAAHHLQRWGGSALLREAVERAEAPPSETVILERDRQWQAAHAQGRLSALGERIAMHPASVYLQQIQQRYAPLFGELFLTDEQGLVVAMSQPLSDYWQGDEAKFLETRELEAGESVIEAVSYDASSQSFLIQLHAPLFDDSGRRRLGTLTFGMNVEAVFAPGGP